MIVSIIWWRFRSLQQVHRQQREDCGVGMFVDEGTATSCKAYFRIHLGVRTEQPDTK